MNQPESEPADPESEQSSSSGLPSHPEEAAQPTRPAFTVSDLFLGKDGLRAVWGIALFLLFREALTYCVFPLLQLLFPRPGPMGSQIAPGWLFLSEGGALLCLLGATGLMALIEMRPVSVYGFSPQRRLRNFAMGVGWGVGLLSLLIAALRAAGVLVFDGRMLSGGSAIYYALLWLVGFALVAATEEIFLRGYLQFTLTRGLSEIYRFFLGPSRANALGFWTAALILSAIFGAGHAANPGETPLGEIAAGLVGLIFCLSLWRTGSLWWAIGFHTAWDWAQSYLYGVADSGLKVQGHLLATHPAGGPYLSGGATGPEGSLLLFPVLLVAVAAVLLTLPRTHSGYQPASSN